ncbi:hypothetical protein CI109_105504 [Kwoniella shandongensis]|uniref:Uncharacterized protein n=1 Tax=Kwoniella shandongensis TaxID=1734106 RepID=A0A5M6C6C2_9TREE|nr:uncharacterized protein CI109_002225 [Kwoniella shandongensis]KAA5529332.1 hypothetical protein CI109_002225 [Kwoniella shandongensis]
MSRTTFTLFSLLTSLIVVSADIGSYLGAAAIISGANSQTVSASNRWDCQYAVQALNNPGLTYSYWNQNGGKCIASSAGPRASDLINSFEQDANYYVVNTAGVPTWTACEEGIYSYTPAKTATVVRPEECLAFCSSYPGISNIATATDNYHCACYSQQIYGYNGRSCKLDNIFIFHNTPAELASGFQATGACIAEGSTGRALTGPHTSSSSMTPATCTNFCSSQGYAIAGVEYGSECWCGNVLSSGASLSKTSTRCNVKCSGASDLTCGGPASLNLYANSNAVSQLSSDWTTKPVVLPEGWSAASSPCVQEGTTGRALASARTSGKEMTVGKCLAFCGNAGWQWAGLEYSSECYCGDYLANGASLSSTSDRCTMTCSGDSSTTCGGSNALQLYNNPSLALSKTVKRPYNLSGCIKEVAGRALNATSINTSDLTIDSCLNFCGSQGYTYAGMEYGAECYCGNELVNGSGEDQLSTQCKTPCAGDATQNCGGPNAISLWVKPRQK